MQRLWGRKISDLAFGEFLKILEWIAKKKGKQVVYIDRWYPSSKTCSNCEHVLESLDLSVREWRCPCCQSVNGRDENAAKNTALPAAMRYILIAESDDRREAGIKTVLHNSRKCCIQVVGASTIKLGDVSLAVLAIAV